MGIQEIIADGKKYIATVIRLHKEGLDENAILEQLLVDASKEALKNAIADLFGKSPERAPVGEPILSRACAPGFFLHDSDTQPMGLEADEWVVVISKAGHKSVVVVHTMRWQNVDQWRLAGASDIAEYFKGWRQHLVPDKQQMPAELRGVAGRTVVETVSHLGRYLTTSATNIDWEEVLVWRYVKV